MSYYISITINKENISENLNGFPVYIDLSILSDEFWNNLAHSDGRDIRVYDNLNNHLPFDLVYCDKILKVGSIFVKSNLSTTEDTIINLHFGDSNKDFVPMDNSYGRNAVWSDYESVLLFGLQGGEDRTGKHSAVMVGDAFCFDLVSSSPDLQSIQGICWDGTYYYTTHTYSSDTKTIKKWDSSWNLIDTNDNPLAGLSNVDHLGDLEYYDGKLYIPIEQYPMVDGNRYICTFDATTLDFISAVDIKINNHEAASICYCDKDGLFYVVSYEDGSKIHRYNQDLSYNSYLTPDLSILHLQGITWWQNRFWLQADLNDETVPMTYEGVCGKGNCDPTTGGSNINGYGGIFGPSSNCDEYEGIGHTDSYLLTMRRYSGSSSYVDVWRPKNLSLSAGGIYTPELSDSQPRVYNITSSNIFTLGITGSIHTKSNHHDVLISYNQDDSVRTTLAWRQNTSIGFGLWDDKNLWLMTNPLINPTIDQKYRLHVIYDNTSYRKLYLNGNLSNSQNNISASSSSATKLLIGHSTESSSVQYWNGDLGYTYLRLGVLSDNWINTEYNNLNNPNSFYTFSNVEEVLENDFDITGSINFDIDISSTSSYTSSNTPNTHRYWRLLIPYPNPGTFDIGFAEIEFRDTIGGNDLTGQGIGNVIYSSQVYSYATTAFDNDIGSNFATQCWSRQYIGWDFGEGNDVDVKEVYITGRTDSWYNQTPQNFKLQYSDDNITWTTKYVWYFQTAWEQSEIRTFNVNNSQNTQNIDNYRYYRIFGFSQDRSNLSVAEIELHSTRGGSDEAIGGTATSDSVYIGDYPPNQAFDDDPSRIWNSNAYDSLHWIQYDFGEGNSKKIIEFTWRSRSDGYTGESPLDIFLQGSNDATNWNNIIYVEEQPAWSTNEQRVFSIPNIAYVNDSTINFNINIPSISPLVDTGLTYWADGIPLFTFIRKSSDTLDYWADGRPNKFVYTQYFIRKPTGGHIFDATSNTYFSIYPSSSYYLNPKKFIGNLNFNLSPSSVRKLNIAYEFNPTITISIGSSTHYVFVDHAQNNFTTDSGVMALWNFESGDLSKDSINNNRLSFSANSPVADTSIYKRGSSALNFTRANSQYAYITDVNLPSDFPLKSGTNNKVISITGWYYFKTGNGYSTIVSKQNWSAGDCTFVYRTSIGNAGHEIIVATASGQNIQTIDVGIAMGVTAGKWYHFLITIDGINKTIFHELYDLTTDYYNSITKTFTNELYLGSADFRLACETGGNYADIILDEVIVFNRLITKFEHQKIIGNGYNGLRNNNFNNNIYLYSQYNFDGADIHEDTSGNGNTLTDSGTPQTWGYPYGVTGSVSAYCYGIGGAGHFKIDDANLNSGFPLKTGDQVKKLTWSTIFCPRLWGSTVWPGVILSQKYSNSSGGGLLLYTDSTGNISIHWGDIDSTNSNYYVGYTVKPRHFYHMTLVVDGIAKSMKLIIFNYSDKSTFTYTNTANKELSTSIYGFHIGGQTSGAAAEGNYDEVLVFNNLLSNQNISDITNGVYVYDANNSEYEGNITITFNSSTIYTINYKNTNDYFSDPNIIFYFPLDETFDDLIQNKDSFSFSYPTFTTDHKAGSHAANQLNPVDGMGTALGNNAYYIPFSSSDQIKKATIAFWCYLKSNGDNLNFLTKWDTPSFNIYLNNNTVKMDISSDGINVSETLNTEFSMDLNEWYYFALVLDFSGSNKNVTIHLYKNSNSTLYTYNTIASHDINLNDSRIWIGQNTTGYIDDWVIFNRNLTQAQILQICQTKNYEYNPNNNDFSDDDHCFAVWNFDNNYSDSKGTNSLTSTTKTYSDLTMTGIKSAYISSINDIGYITDSNLVNNFPLKSTTTNKQFTICLWHKVGNNNETLLSKGYYGNNTRSFSVKVVSGELRLYCGYSSGSFEQEIRTGISFNVWEWYHIGLIIDGTNKSIIIYVRRAMTNTLYTYSGSMTNQLYFSNDPLVIGGQQSNSEGTTFENPGYGIDEVVFFDRLLISQEIEKIYLGEYYADIPIDFEYTGNIDFDISLSCIEDVDPRRYDGSTLVNINLSSIYEYKYPMVFFDRNGSITYHIYLSSVRSHTMRFQPTTNMRIVIGTSTEYLKSLNKLHVKEGLLSFTLSSSADYDYGYIPTQFNTVHKLQPKYMCIEFNNEMDMSLITKLTRITADTMVLNGNFRTRNDIGKICWNVEDVWSHALQKYSTDNDFSNVILEYRYFYEDTNTLGLDSSEHFSMTVTDIDDTELNINLWNYVMDRPLESWENIYGLFPQNRTPSSATNRSGNIKIDFNNFYCGENPSDPNWRQIDSTQIKKIIWNIYPSNYIQGNEKEPTGLNKSFEIIFNNWTVVNGELPDLNVLSETATGLFLNYDLIYYLTPQRVLEHYYSLGFRNNLNLCIGNGKWYDKQPVLDEEGHYSPADENYHTKYLYNLNQSNYLNRPFSEWTKNFLNRANIRGFRNITISIPMELIDVNINYCQKTYEDTSIEYYNDSRPIKYIAPANDNALSLYKNIFSEIADLEWSQTYIQKLQLFSPKIERNENNIPQFYDTETLDTYYEETGGDIYTLHTESIFDQNFIDSHLEFLEWLNDKVCLFTNEICYFMKNRNPDFKFSLGLDLSYVLDSTRFGMLTYVNNLLSLVDSNAFDEFQFIMNGVDIYGDYYNLSQKMLNEINSANIRVKQFVYTTGYDIDIEYTEEIMEKIKRSINNGNIISTSCPLNTVNYFNENNLEIPQAKRTVPEILPNRGRYNFSFRKRIPEFK